MVTPGARDRLISAALGLFAQQGFDGTSVGDIEEAAGFTRRGRAFYRHFGAKDDVLVAGIERHLASVERLRDAASLLPFGDIEAELTLICRWTLAELASEADLVRLMEREGHRVPELRDRMKGAFVDDTHRMAAGIIQRWVTDHGGPMVDADALASVLLGPVVNYRRTIWTYGSPPLDVDEDRFIRACVAVGVAWTSHWTRQKG